MSDLPPLAYSRPTTLAALRSALKRRGACIYAGGTDLLVALQRRDAAVRAVRELVDIKGITQARGITDLGSQLRIGSLTTAAELAASRLVGRFAPALAEAAALTSAPQLRRRGTLGGNLATPHPAGDVATALLALGATVEVALPSGATRSVPVEAVLRRAPGRSLYVTVRVPKCRTSAFAKIGARPAFSRALVSVAVAHLPDGVRVALGGLAERPFLARQTAGALDAGGDPAAAILADLDRSANTGMSAARLRQAAVLVARVAARAMQP